MNHLIHSVFGLLGHPFIETLWPGEQLLKIPFVTIKMIEKRKLHFKTSIENGYDVIILAPLIESVPKEISIQPIPITTPNHPPLVPPIVPPLIFH